MPVLSRALLAAGLASCAAGAGCTSRGGGGAGECLALGEDDYTSLLQTKKSAAEVSSLQTKASVAHAAASQPVATGAASKDELAAASRSAASTATGGQAQVAAASQPSASSASTAVAKAKAAGGKEHRRRQGPSGDVDMDELWHQLTGAVQIEDIQKKIHEAQDSDTAQQLMDKLTELRTEFPQADEIKEQFQGQWDEVSQAVNMELVYKALNDAKAQAESGETVAQLQQQLDSLKTQLPDFDLQEAQTKAADAWLKLQEQGVPLPNLDTLEQQAQEALDQAQAAAQNALGNVEDAIGNLFR